MSGIFHSPTLFHLILHAVQGQMMSFSFHGQRLQNSERLRPVTDSWSTPGAKTPGTVLILLTPLTACKPHVTRCVMLPTLLLASLSMHEIRGGGRG